MGILSKKKINGKAEEEVKALVSKIQRLYRDAYNNKASLHEMWDKCFKAYNSDLFKKNLPNYKIQEISNFVFGTIETVKPIMLANNPKFLVMPKTEASYPKSRAVQYALEHEWSRTKMFTKLLQSVTYGLIYGTVPIALLWDENASKGIGEVVPMVLSPFNVFVDPMATCVEDAEYIGYATYKPVGQVIRAFQGQADEIRNNAAGIEDTYLAYGKDMQNVSSRDQILYIEIYMRDYSTEETEEEGEDGNRYKVTKQKYPNGRRVIIAGDVLLDDAENPYADGKFPFVMWKCYDVPNQFWGIGEVQMIISPQEAICEINNAIIESAGLTGNPIWILDKNSGVEKNSLTNQKGLVVRKNPGTEVRREAPQALPSYIQNIVVDMKSDIERISGVYDVTRGERPAGITAAAAIQALNEQAQGRILLKVQAMEQMLGELGSMWLSRIQQFWVTKRSVRIMGLEYTPNSDADGAMQPQAEAAPGLPVNVMQLGTKQIGFADMSGDDVDGDFDIYVVGGSTMQTNKSAKLQNLVQLAQTTAEDGLPMVDRQTVLENADIDNVEEVIQRFEAIKQQQAQNAPQDLPKVSIAYTDLPPEGKVQAAQMAGIQIQPEQIVAAQRADIANETDAEMQKMQAQGDMQMQQSQQQAQVQQEQTVQQQDADAQKMMMEHAMQKDMASHQSALQKEQDGIQSKSEGQASPTQEEIDSLVNELSQMKPEEVQALFSQFPQLKSFLESLIGQTEQS